MTLEELIADYFARNWVMILAIVLVFGPIGWWWEGQKEKRR